MSQQKISFSNPPSIGKELEPIQKLASQFAKWMLWMALGLIVLVLLSLFVRLAIIPSTNIVGDKYVQYYQELTNIIINQTLSLVKDIILTPITPIITLLFGYSFKNETVVDE